jgi:hypothetical protein
MKAWRWLAAHRTLARLIVRGPIREWISRRVWADIEKEASFLSAFREGQADFAAGRWYHWSSDGTTTPNPDWPADGPRPSHR